MKARTVTRVLAAAAVLWFGAGITAAPADEPEFYLGLKGVGGFAEIEDISTTGVTALQINNDDDQVAGLSGVFGYRFGNIPLRTEAEIGYRFRFDFDARDNGPPIIGYENNLSTLSALLNIAWEIRHFGPDWVPYLGATIGWARNTSEIERNTFVNGITTTENDSDNLALGVNAGFLWNVADSVALEFGYRLINLGEVESGTLGGGETINAENYISNEAVFSVNYRF